MLDTQAQTGPNSIITAARMQIAEHGLRGLSLRKVAARAGSSRGGVVYRAGRKSELLSNVLADCVAFQHARHQHWLALTATLDLSSHDVLAAVVGSFLDEAVTICRAQSVVLCELQTESARRKERHAELAGLVQAEEDFWRDLQRGAADASILGWAIANFCRDELPFALALHGQPEYTLLKAATISRLVSRMAPTAQQGFAMGFEPFVAAPPRTADDTGDKRSRELERAIAALIHQAGVAGLTHRSVAASAGIPKSSIAHHFRTREDLLKAGLAEIYRQLTAADRLLMLDCKDMPNMTLSIASHAIAIEATRDASLVPATLALRKRRGEFIWKELATMFGAGRSDLMALNAAGMVVVGAGLGLHLAGGEMLRPMRLLERLVFGASA